MDAAVKDGLAEMRQAFGARDADKVVEIYEAIRPSLKGSRADRVEATCLAVRALVAMKHRKLAKGVMERVSNGTYVKAVHYEYLAGAYLALKQYAEAGEACKLAHEFRQREETSRR